MTADLPQNNTTHTLGRRCRISDLQRPGPRRAAQRFPLPGAGQVANSAGGYVFEADDWRALRRFLILGSEGGSYYATESKLPREGAQVLERCIAADGKRAVREIVAVSDAGRA